MLSLCPLTHSDNIFAHRSPIKNTELEAALYTPKAGKIKKKKTLTQHYETRNVQKCLFSVGRLLLGMGSMLVRGLLHLRLPWRNLTSHFQVVKTGAGFWVSHGSVRQLRSALGPSLSEIICVPVPLCLEDLPSLVSSIHLALKLFPFLQNSLNLEGKDLTEPPI